MKKTIFLFVIFFGILTYQISAQTIPTRLDIPGWVNMGMDLAQVLRGTYNNDHILRPSSDANNQYYYLTGDDLCIIIFEPGKGVVAFEYGFDYNVKAALQLFNYIYGEPFFESNVIVIWKVPENLRSIDYIVIYIDNNYNYLNLLYIFDNYFDD